MSKYNKSLFVFGFFLNLIFERLRNSDEYNYAKNQKYVKVEIYADYT